MKTSQLNNNSSYPSSVNQAFLIITLMIVYLGTICPTVYLGDSGELTAAALSLGVPHGSGYPLYVIIGKLFCMIPIGSIGFRMNLMSATLSTITVWVVYLLIFRATESNLASTLGSLVLAFSPIFWEQTIATEVYALHVLFIALIFFILSFWEERRDFKYIALLAFITGLSFCNHLQTVMLAPAVLFFVISGNWKDIFSLKRFLIIAILFSIALLTYIFLPLRTIADAAIHWGEPDTLARFLAHVSGKSHRAGYVLNLSPFQYYERLKEAVVIIFSSLGFLLIPALWGFVKLPSIRWKTFTILIILFDFFYTVFLNTVTIAVTPFGLTSVLILSVLIGVGLHDLLCLVYRLGKNNKTLNNSARVAACILPVILLVSNYSLTDQSENYTGYEHMLNILRTVSNDGILFINSDNHTFPVAYGRIVEKRREDIKIYDNLNLIFKISGLDNYSSQRNIGWEDSRNNIITRIISNNSGNDIYYAVYNDNSIKLPEKYSLIPYGLINKAVTKDSLPNIEEVGKIWKTYATESILYGTFERDYMNREIATFFYYKKGIHNFLMNMPDVGIKYFQIASKAGYDNAMIHSDMGIFLIDRGFFDMAYEELEKAMTYSEEKSGIYNNWGYYYSKLKNYDRATEYFNKAIELDPENFAYYNNLALNHFEAGERDKAISLLKESLAIKRDQPGIRKLLKDRQNDM